MLSDFSITVTDEIEIASKWAWTINVDYSNQLQLQEFIDDLQAKSWSFKELKAFMKLRQVEWKLDGTKISITKKKKRKKEG